MTAADFAELLHGRRSGPGKWRASCPCPVHSGNSKKLSIAEGHDGRVLVFCFAGCNTANVLGAMELEMADLFPGPPPTAEQGRQLAAERIQRVTAAREVRLQRGWLADRYRKLTALVESVGEKLARLPNGAPTEKALTQLFHLALDRQRATESELEANDET